MPDHEIQFDVFPTAAVDGARGIQPPLGLDGLLMRLRMRSRRLLAR